jgi:hypothetical protein
MKSLYILILSAVISLTASSCNPVWVSTDYDTHTDFTAYKSFAFYKTGIDKAPISELDKRRILRAIDQEMQAKGFTKSEQPDLLVSIYTKARQRVDVYDPHWYPYYYGPYYRSQVAQYTEGTLFIDIIDKKAGSLIWQGAGTGYISLSGKPEKRDAQITRFVHEVMNKFPPK